MAREIALLKVDLEAERSSFSARLLRAILPLPGRAGTPKKDGKVDSRPVLAGPSAIGFKRGASELMDVGEKMTVKEEKSARTGNAEMKVGPISSPGTEPERVLKRARPSSTPLRRPAVRDDPRNRRPAWYRRLLNPWGYPAVGFPIDLTLSDKDVRSERVEVDAAADAALEPEHVEEVSVQVGGKEGGTESPTALPIAQPCAETVEVGNI
jgi:hypothetical protein